MEVAQRVGAELTFAVCLEEWENLESDHTSCLVCGLCFLYFFYSKENMLSVLANSVVSEPWSTKCCGPSRFCEKNLCVVYSTIIVFHSCMYAPLGT